jgi:hypothetical protein
LRGLLSRGLPEVERETWRFPDLPAELAGAQARLNFAGGLTPGDLALVAAEIDRQDHRWVDDRLTPVDLRLVVRSRFFLVVGRQDHEFDFVAHRQYVAVKGISRAIVCRPGARSSPAESEHLY